MTFKRTFHAVETHSGEPMRVITGGVPHIPGNTVYEQMKWLEKNDDHIRMLMLREPRGYPPLCCYLVVPAKHPDADWTNAVKVASGAIDFDNPATWTGPSTGAPVARAHRRGWPRSMRRASST